MPRPARVVIASYLVRFPVGGYQSWMLQWLLGFHRLGHEVYFVEKSGWPGSCMDPCTWIGSDDCSKGVRAICTLLTRFGLGDRWCFVDAAGRYHGMSRERVEEIFRTCDLFIDHMRDPEWAEESAHAGLRVLVDGEPAYCQIRMERQSSAGAVLPEYDHYYSVGLNIGTAASIAPTAGRHWRAIFDPVVVSLFPDEPPPPGAPFTTVMSWKAHHHIEFNGATYGQKDVEFARFMDLPGRVTATMELAVAGKTPAEELQANGWVLRDAPQATLNFDAWRDYIRLSAGEFSVAKNVFVATNSGFFSDRTAAYLASGRPVVMQDTGFSAHLPCGEGLFAVRNVEEAADAIHRIQADYPRHARAARCIASEFLDTTVVLPRLLREVGL